MTEEQIIRLYGKRCAEHCDDCCVCEVWAMHDLIETQAREIERLREALEFYANNKNYRYIIGVGCTSVDIDAGNTARAALAGDSHD